MIKYTTLDNMPPKKVPTYGPLLPIRPTFEAWWRHYMHLRKITDYMYRIWIPYADYKRAILHLDSLQPNSTDGVSGGCSAFRIGKYHCRNLDYNFDEVAYFHTYIPRSPRTKHASMTICGFSSVLTKAFVESEDWSEAYIYMPCFVSDGINDVGVTVNQNNVSHLDNPIDPTKGNIVTGTNPEKSKLPTSLVSRFILDNAGSVDEAVQLLYTVNIYTPTALQSRDCLHWIISDRTKSVVVEIIDNVIYSYDASILTNFYLYGFDGDVSNICLQEIEAKSLARNTTVTPHANGLERYKYIKTQLAIDSTLPSLMHICRYLHYSNTYKRETVPYWYSEYYDNHGAIFGNLTFANSAEDFSYIINYYITEYNKKLRNGITWRTTHTSIYNINDLQMILQVQENDDVYTFNLHDFMRIDTDALGDMTKWVHANPNKITCTHPQLPPPPQYIDWENILNKPEVFTPAPHKHTIDDITAGGYISTVQIVRPPCPETLWLVLEFYSDPEMKINVGTIDQRLTSDAANMKIDGGNGYVTATVYGFDISTIDKHIIVDVSGLTLPAKAYVRWSWYASDKTVVASSTFAYPSATPFDTIAMGLVTQGG